jgi:hypothetical protein
MIVPAVCLKFNCLIMATDKAPKIINCVYLFYNLSCSPRKKQAGSVIMLHFYIMVQVPTGQEISFPFPFEGIVTPFPIGDVETCPVGKPQ